VNVHIAVKQKRPSNCSPPLSHCPRLNAAGCDKRPVASNPVVGYPNESTANGSRAAWHRWRARTCTMTLLLLAGGRPATSIRLAWIPASSAPVDPRPQLAFFDKIGNPDLSDSPTMPAVARRQPQPGRGFPTDLRREIPGLGPRPVSWRQGHPVPASVILSRKVDQVRGCRVASLSVEDP